MEYDIKDMCSFSLGRGKYCTGDTQKPATHAPECPHYVEVGRIVD